MKLVNLSKKENKNIYGVYASTIEDEALIDYFSGSDPFSKFMEHENTTDLTWDKALKVFNEAAKLAQKHYKGIVLYIYNKISGHPEKYKTIK